MPSLNNFFWKHAFYDIVSDVDIYTSMRDFMI